MCRYPSKKCYNTRAVKRNGELHNLCDFHRQKANKNQRRLELKRKTRVQAAESQPLEKRLKQNKKPRQRTRRAPLSAHVAMQEEVRARRQAAAEATRGAAAVVPPSIATSFLQDLVMLDGVYDRTGFLPKVEPRALISMPLELTPLPTLGMGMQGLTSVKEEVLDRILLDGANDIAASVDANPTKLESLGSTVPEGKTSPVDVGENWGNLDFSDYWMVPSDQPTMSFDASSFVVDEDVFIADEWTNLMKAGRKLHGKKWGASNGDEPSLMELMELHKEELLEYKRSLENNSDSSRQRGALRTASLERKAARPSKFNLPLLKLQPVAPLPSASHGTGATTNPGQTKFISTQWQSTRLTAQSRTAVSARPTPFQSALPDDSSDISPPTLVPPLNFSRLGGGPAVVVPTEKLDEPMQKEKRKSFEATFQRQTRLAAMLRKKK
ncbi:hypothetical protein BBJ29_002934 [Phytophthora kernoviae]|uniref:Uncharacterized protein n=1 Tax=Phytophthora kernoviae TaxID=325452 RepID=A0A3F2S565_9STRA|nr:hypothetical protein BBJ29_002934 [Phytophthora kernoviae]RLN69726.1 hypothetical protein BBP00_00000197 [Phytophthora kernoviae]